MTQQEIDYGPRVRGMERFEQVRDVFRECIAVVGLKVIAAQCRTSDKYIQDALDGRDRKYIREEWLLIVEEMVPDELALRLARARHSDRFEIDLKSPLTPEQMLKRYVEVTKKRAGPLADEIMDEVLGRRR